MSAPTRQRSRNAAGSRQVQAAAATTDASWPPIAPLALIIFAATLVAYHPAWHGGILWDDDGHLTRPELRSWAGLGRIWFELGATQQYYPLAHSAFWALTRVGGGDTLAFHLANILFHATSAVLVVVLLRRLAIPGAAIAGVIFALHPVQVESVAWMTELKNTLSGVCYFAAALAYLQFDERRRPTSYARAALWFLLALAAKTVTATLPAGLLVALWWKRGRLDGRRDIAPLAPLFAVGMAAAAVTSWVEHHQIGASGAVFDLSFVERLLVASRAVWFYLWKLVWPSPLIFTYPKWTISPADVIGWVALAGVAAALVALWLVRGRWRGPLAALLYFGVTLSPALGFVSVYPFRYSYVADHFQYLACLGPIALFAAAVTRWSGRPPSRTTASLVLAAIGVVLGGLTAQQSRTYVNAETLYRATLTANPSSWMALNNLGAIELADGSHRVAEARSLLEASLRLNPDNADARLNLSAALLQTGQTADALREGRAAVALEPGNPSARANLGAALESSGDAEGAEREYRETLRLAPSHEVARRNLGNLLQRLGRFDEAAIELNAALALKPDDAAAHSDLGTTRLKQGRLDEAVTSYREAIRLDPAALDARFNLSVALRRAGRPAEAAAVLVDAVKVAPDSSIAHAALASVLQELSRPADAVAEYQAAIRTAGDTAPAKLFNDYGVALATAGRLTEAAAAFREALRRQPDYPEAKANLAKIGRQ